ncbi:MAG TPA: flagellin [Methanolinea sp.]|nr:flagellin [Methanolinea sp.]
MKKFNKEDAFTGLEAAIVLIAFVVVAAVFSYVVLGAGFFTTQKSQEVVHSGVTQAASNLVVKGEVYGIKNTTADTVEYIRFDVGLAAGGLPIDMNRTAMVYSTTGGTVYTITKDNSGAIPNSTMPAPGHWGIMDRRPDLDNDVLQSDSLFTIYVTPEGGISPRERFNIEIKPEIGASLGIERTVPPSLTAVTLLY